MATAQRRVCALCHREPLSFVVLCHRCLEGVDKRGVVSHTYYCSEECRDKNTTAHAQLCRDRNIRKRLYRGADILQGVFYDWREIAFDMNIELVEQHGDRLCFWQGYPYSGGTGFFPFPHRLVAGSKDVKALLSYRSCYRAPEITFELTKKLFDGIASRIEFVHLWPASGKYTVFASDDDVTFLHEVLALDALDGNSYILDLTGAQLGFRDSLTPLDEYLHKLGARIVKIQHHDFALAQFKRNLHQHSQCVTVTMQHEMYKSLNYAVEEFEDQMQVSLPVMLRFQEWQFENYASFLASCMRLGLETTFKSRVKAGHPGVSVDESALSIVELRCLLPLKLKDDTGSGVFRQWKREHEAHARARANAPSMWSKLSAWLGRLFFPLKKQE